MKNNNAPTKIICTFLFHPIYTAGGLTKSIAHCNSTATRNSSVDYNFRHKRPPTV